MRILALLIILVIMFPPFAYAIEDVGLFSFSTNVTVDLRFAEGNRTVSFEVAELRDEERYLAETEAIFAQPIIDFNCGWPEDIIDYIRNLNITKAQQNVLIKSNQNAYDDCIKNQTITNVTTNVIIEETAKSEIEFSSKEIMMMVIPIVAGAGIGGVIAVILQLKFRKS